MKYRETIVNIPIDINEALSLFFFVIASTENASNGFSYT